MKNFSEQFSREKFLEKKFLGKFSPKELKTNSREEINLEKCSVLFLLWKNYEIRLENVHFQKCFLVLKRRKHFLEIHEFSSLEKYFIFRKNKQTQENLENIFQKVKQTQRKYFP